jgi:hypothetical protein
MGAAGEVFSELRTGCRELFQRGQSVTQHGMPIKTVARLVECPESLNIVRIEFKELMDKALGNFGGRQVHLVEGAEQSQQIEAGRFQAWAEVDRDFEGSTRSHGPSMVDQGAEVQRAVGRSPRPEDETKGVEATPRQEKSCAAGRGVPSYR